MQLRVAERVGFMASILRLPITLMHIHRGGTPSIVIRVSEQVILATERDTTQRVRRELLSSARPPSSKQRTRAFQRARM